MRENFIYKCHWEYSMWQKMKFENKIYICKINTLYAHNI